jgi:protocatechuate 3,4-dioxygenase alpha subunit
VKDALVEIWQADANGRYGANNFSGFGRAAADFDTGLFFFETVKPGRAPYRDGRMQAPHVTLSIFARGINIHLQTRLSSPRRRPTPDPAALVGAPDLVATLIAQRDPARPLYRFDVHLQGDRETVFFDL